MGAQLIFKQSTLAGVPVVKGGNAGTNLWCTFLTLIHEGMGGDTQCLKLKMYIFASTDDDDEDDDDDDDDEDGEKNGQDKVSSYRTVP